MDEVQGPVCPQQTEVAAIVYDSISIVKCDNGYLVSANAKDYRHNRNSVALSIDEALDVTRNYIA